MQPKVGRMVTAGPVLPVLSLLLVLVATPESAARVGVIPGGDPQLAERARPCYRPCEAQYIH